jgi:hypothetical protein
MDVDEAGGDDEAFAVDDRRGAAIRGVDLSLAADLDDPLALEQDVPHEARGPTSIDNEPAA